ncbi:hypothetical protein ACAG96_06555 [Candidatus Izemoplasma sp. B36]|uniref:hypothetical protein n=1 Tax=Candidatus Izemoplasma sp. B36 TaxID=3242468 RepID=UPI003556FD5B
MIERKWIVMLATLTKLQNNQITPEKAYTKIYQKSRIKRIPFYKRAHFIKLSINVPDEKGVNAFLKVLFFLPIPILFLRIILGFVKMDKFNDDMPLTKREMIRLIAFKGVKVKVNANKGEKVYIRTF